MLMLSNTNFNAKLLRDPAGINQKPLNTWTGRLLGIFVTFYPLRISRNDNNITCAAMKKK